MDWNPVACERELARAIQLNPSNAFARMSYALFLVTVPGDFSKAMEQARLGLETDPLSEHMNFAYAWILFFAGEYEFAREHALKALKMYRDSLHLHFVLGWSQLGISRIEGAVMALKKAAEISRDTIALGYLGYACGMAGLRGEAQAILRELTERSALEDITLTSLAYLHIGLGDFDRAFECLEKCLDDRDSRIFWFPPTVFSESFSADPRYNRLLDRMQETVRKSVANS
jgi:tetratricopeptide (TPR) repeat protein